MKAIANRLTQVARMAALAFAVLAVGSTWAVTTTGYEDFGDTAGVVLWRGTEANFHASTVIDVAEDGTLGTPYAMTADNSATSWQRFAKGQTAYTSPGKVLVYDTPGTGSGYKYNPDCTFTPISFGGMWVQTLAINGQPFSILGNNAGKRYTEFGASDKSTLFKFDASFTINRTSLTTFFGEATVDIADGATFTAQANSSYHVVVDSAATLKLKGAGTLAVTTMDVNGTLDLSATTRPTISGNVTLVGTIVLPEGTEVSQENPFTICSGTLSAANAYVKIGDAEAVEKRIAVSGGAITGFSDPAYEFTENYPTVVPAGQVFTFIGGETAESATVASGVTVNGTLKTRGYISLSGLTTAKESTLEVVDGTATVTASAKQALTGDIKIDAGATMVNAFTEDALNYGWGVYVHVYGTLDMRSTRWTVGSNARIHLYEGGVITGVGQGSNGAIDITSSNVRVIAHCDSTISANMRVRAENIPFEATEGKTLTISGLINDGVSYSQPGSITKQNSGTLVLTTAPTFTKALKLEAGTLELGGTAASASVTVAASAATVAASSGSTLTGDLTFVAHVPSAANKALIVSDSFTGKVILTGDFGSSASVSLSGLGDAVTLKDFTGFLNKGWDATNTRITIEGTFTQNNGWSGSATDVTQDAVYIAELLGAGTMTQSGAQKQSYIVGNIANFTGTFNFANSRVKSNSNAVLDKAQTVATLTVAKTLTVNGGSLTGNLVAKDVAVTVDGTPVAGDVLVPVSGTVSVSGIVTVNGNEVAVECVAGEGVKFVAPLVTINVPKVANTTVAVSVGGSPVSPATEGESTNTYSVVSGSTVTVTYTAAEGYVFGDNVATKTVSFDDVSENKTVTTEAVGTTSAVVAKLMPAETPYADLSEAVLSNMEAINAGTSYVQVIDDTDASNILGGYGIAYDDIAKQYVKSVAIIVVQGNAAPGYRTVQAALDVATDGQTVKLQANCEEELVLTNGAEARTVTIDAKGSGQTVYTYTPPKAEDDAYTVVAGETEGNATPYTARDWYSWTVTVVAENATVTGFTSPVSEASPAITFTVAAAETYKVTSVQVNGTEVGTTDGEYNATLTGNTTITVTTELDVATVTFYNEDGTATLQSGDVTIGQVPTAPGAPEKATTAQYTYTFAGWATEQGGAALAELPAVAAGGATYYAVYAATLRSYLIVFRNADGTGLQSGQVDYGIVPEYKGATPTKASTAEFDYTFDGWTPAIASVTGDAIYTATYTPVKRSYGIVFQNENGTALQSGPVEYGVTPAYAGETPTKESTDEYSYTFAGWTPAIASVTGDAIYTATYTPVKRSYTVTFTWHGGSAESSVEYGATPTAPADPEKYVENNTIYTFAGWEPAVVSVTGAATYTAQYESVAAVAKIGDDYYTTVDAAIAAAQDGETVTMLADVTLTAPMDVQLGGKAVTLDLGGRTLTGRTNLKSGSLTVQNGTVVGGAQQALNVYGSATPAENYSVLTIAGNVTVTADVYGVCLFGPTYSAKSGYGAVINLAGTVTTTGDGRNGAVFVSGNLGNNVAGDANNIINVTGSITSATDAAIALNGLATVNVAEGAVVVGDTAIAVKRGTLNVTGGTVHATGAKNYGVAAYGNGTEMTGAAISITDTYNKYGPMSVAVSGGVITSDNADALFKKEGAYTNDATMTVTGGEFSSAVPLEYCAPGFIPADNGSGSYGVEPGWVITFVVEGVETKVPTAAGETPAYDGTPAKAEDDAYTYAFAGWTPTIVAATGAVTYTATFTPVPKDVYDVTLTLNSAAIKVGNTTTLTVNISKNGTPFSKLAEYSAEKTKWSLVVADGECASVTAGPKAYYNRIIYNVKGLKAGATTLTYQNVDNPSLRFTVELTVNHNLEVSYDSSYSAQKGALVENGLVAFTSIKLDGVEVEDRDAYTFTSEDTSIATVDKTGVTPVGVGFTYVNITLESDPTITLRKAIKVVAAAAKIGDDYYATIADAFTAATDGQTIVLLKDVTESADYSTSDIEVTLDLNGFIWTGASNREYTLRVRKGVVTVTDNSSGHTGAVTYGKDYALIVDHVANNTVRSKLVLNSGTFTGKSSVVQAGTLGGSGANTKYYGGDLVVNGGTFVTVDDTNDEHDTNGHFKYTLNKLDVGSVTVFTPSTITVNGGTFQNFDPANNVAEGTGTNFVPAGYVSLANTPSEGWYTVTGLVTFAVTAPAHTVVTVPGATNNGDGTFTVAPGTVVTIVYTAEEGYVFADNTTVKNVSYTANGGEVAEAEAAVAAVAKINTTPYSSLEAALAAAESGNTVTLLADVVPSATTVINGSVTLDLGGKTITGRVTVNTGTVTVQNGTVNGRFDAYDDSVVTLAATATVNGMVVVWGDGTFGKAGCKTPTLNVYGTITNSGEQAISTNGTDTSNPVINIYDGAVVLCEADDVGVFLPSGNLTVYGGTVTGATAVYVKSGSITVTGGTLTGIGSEHEYEYKGDGCTATGDAIVIDNAAYPNGTPVVAISGGKFVSNNASAIGVYAKEGETVVKHFVSGGQFSSQLTADLCATGFFPTTVTDSEGFYGVEAGSSVAYRGDDFYETLDAALEDAVDGDTITLLANVAVERTIIEKSVTLDLGGKTITGRVTVNTGTVTVQNGTIAGRFDAYDDSVVTLAATATVTGQVVVWGDGTFGAAGCKTPTLNVYGTVTYSGDAAITCNGTDKSQSVINVYAGATVTSDDIAIYMPSGKLTVSGGTITGATAIYSKSGSVAITGGTLTGNGTAADYQYNGNGAYATGDALVVESCSYPNGAPTALVTGGTLVSVNAKAIGCYATTGNSVPKNIVPAKVGSVENAARFKPSASMGIAAGYQLVADGETGFFKLGRIPAPENTVDVVSVADTTIVAIPADCTAAQLINRTNRAVGDVLKAYVKAEKRYYTWKLISTESEADVAWEPVQTWVIGGESATATNTKAATEVLLKKGEAVWVTRVNSSEPVYVNGTYAEEVTSSTVQVETGYNLVAPVPTEEQAEAAEIVINEVVEKTETTVADNDKIIVPPTETSAPVQLDCKVDEVTGKPEWGYFHIETYTDEATGKTRTRRVRKTDVKIPAGTGFWYISGRNKDISL